MNDGSANNRLDVGDIARQLREGRLSRGSLFDRLKGLGIGFGAAFVLGIAGAHAAATPEASVALKSTNPALNAIIQDGPKLPAAGAAAPLQQMSYFRVFRRFFSRHYRRF